MDGVKEEEKNLIKDHSYDIKDNPEYEEYFREVGEEQKPLLDWKGTLDVI